VFTAMPPLSPASAIPKSCDLTIAFAEDLCDVVATAHRSLGSAAVLIVQGAGGRRSAVVAADGVETNELREALPWLSLLEQELGDGPTAVIDATTQIREAGALAALGSATMLSSPLRLDGRRLGTMHVLTGVQDSIDLTLVEAIAAHCAIALARSRLRRTEAAGSRPILQTPAVDQLLLATDFTALIQVINDAVQPRFGAVSCGVMVWEEERKVLQMIPGSFGASESVTASYRIDPRDLHSNAALVFELQRPYLTNHAVGDPGILQEYAEAFGLRRFLSVPLRAGSRPLGVLTVASRADGVAAPDQEGKFTVADLAACERFAPQVSAALEITSMLTQARRQRSLDAVLARAALAVAQGRPAASFLDESLEGLRNVMRAGIIALVPTVSPPIIARSNINAGAVEALVDEARARRQEDDRLESPSGVGDPGAAVCHVPVRLGEQHMGTLSAMRCRAEPFNDDERRGLARMASVAALAWAAHELHRQRSAVARLEERQRIADDLHDDVSQILFAAQMQLDAGLEQDGLTAAAADTMSRTRALLVRGEAAIRNVISELSRPSATGLAERLADLVETIEQEFEFPVRLHIDSRVQKAAADARRPIVETLLKVARESLVNVAKHAGPCQVSVCLDVTRRGRLRVRITDDGVGVARHREVRRHGLASIRRAVRKHGGCLRVYSGSAGGTTVQASFPP
jgi:signal transduction histidine kinase